MSQIIINLEDSFAKEVFSYTSQHKTSFEEITKKLWQNLLAKKTIIVEEDDFLHLLDATKGTWQQGDGLTYQENLRNEWD